MLRANLSGAIQGRFGKLRQIKTFDEDCLMRATEMRPHLSMAACNGDRLNDLPIHTLISLIETLSTFEVRLLLDSCLTLV